MDTADTAEKTKETTSDAAQATNEAKPLVLPSLEIKNFRAFKHLTVEKLGRVNLITGKNNVGKTSLLEALTLFSERSIPQATRELLSNRDERVRLMSRKENSPLLLDGERELSDELVSQFNSLFHNRYGNSKTGEIIFIGDTQEIKALTLRISWFRKSDLDYLKEKYKDVESVDPAMFVDAVPCLVFGDVLTGWHGGSRSSLFEIITGKSQEVSHDTTTYRFIGSCGITNEQQSVLWDSIHLTSAEDEVENALRILSPNLLRLAFVPNYNAPQGRIPMVRMEGSTAAVPLRSLGDGVNRMLGYILSMANSAGGILLIDEIENGLHYSVLPDVWRLIFQTARRLNVQVFATTHSWDCIEAFQEAASEDKDPTSGVLVRLQNDGDSVTSTVFDERRLEFVAYNDIEVR